MESGEKLRQLSLSALSASRLSSSVRCHWTRAIPVLVTSNRLRNSAEYPSHYRLYVRASRDPDTRHSRVARSSSGQRSGLLVTHTLSAPVIVCPLLVTSPHRLHSAADTAVSALPSWSDWPTLRSRQSAPRHRPLSTQASGSRFSRDCTVHAVDRTGYSREGTASEFGSAQQFGSAAPRRHSPEQLTSRLQSTVHARDHATPDTTHQSPPASGAVILIVLGVVWESGMGVVWMHLDCPDASIPLPA